MIRRLVAVAGGSMRSGVVVGFGCSGVSADRRRVLGGVLRGLCLAISATAMLWPGVAVGKTFTSTGSQQIYLVPPGVRAVHVLAAAGTGAAVTLSTTGGFGATASANLPVTPGQTLYVEVGGNASGFSGGFNGGGDGDSQCCAGGGGGASDVRTVSLANAGSLNSRLIIAGGGGGAGNGNGGNGDENSPDYLAGMGTGGGAGTTTAGGAGGAACGTTDTFANTGSPGAFGLGGTGGTYGGGGGGGGYYGGGGGGGDAGGGGRSVPPSECGGGGGGGSSYFSPHAIHVSLGTNTSGIPLVEINPDRRRR
jgi:hypothetical protein